mgnify:CR=1 FL=1
MKINLEETLSKKACLVHVISHYSAAFLEKNHCCAVFSVHYCRYLTKMRFVCRKIFVVIKLLKYFLMTYSTIHGWNCIEDILRYWKETWISRDGLFLNFFISQKKTLSSTKNLYQNFPYKHKKDMKNVQFHFKWLSSS